VLSVRGAYLQIKSVRTYSTEGWMVDVSGHETTYVRSSTDTR